MMKLKTSFFCLFLFPVVICGAGKIWNAAYTDKAPVIDGKLDDACWAKAETVDDFVRPGTDFLPENKVSAKMLFDKSGFYVAIKTRLKYPEFYKKYVDDERATRTSGFCPGMKGQSARYEIEMFFDPGVTGAAKQSWQILTNSLGQHSGHRGGVWSVYKFKVTTAGHFENGYWTLESKVEYPGLKKGAVWGWNLAVSEDVPYAVWSNTGGAYFMPSRFGKLMFGTYDEWADAVEKRLNEQLAQVQKHEQEIKSFPYFEKFISAVLKEKKEFDLWRKDHKTLATRTDFENFYSRFTPLDNTFKRCYSLFCLWRCENRARTE
jgi:hypothetical protein